MNKFATTYTSSPGGQKMIEIPAVIQKTLLGVEDHGLFTFTLFVKYRGSSGQGLGGYALDAPAHDDEGKFAGRVGTAYGCEFIKRVIAVTGASSWEDLTGRHIMVFRESRSGHKVYGIGNILDDSKVLLFDDIFNEFKDEETQEIQ